MNHSPKGAASNHTAALHAPKRTAAQSPLGPQGTTCVEVAAKPKCPKCRTDDVKLVSRQHLLVPGDVAADSPSVTISTYKCLCGVGFTDTINREHEPAK
jgi:hypothetical protein